METRGIEPLSEDPSVKTSPITAYCLGFPQPIANRHARGFGSFMNPSLPQSFGKAVPHIVDAGLLVCGTPRADGRYLSSGELIIIVVSFLRVGFVNAVTVYGWLSLFSRSPSKPLRPRVYAVSIRQNVCIINYFVVV